MIKNVTVGLLGFALVLIAASPARANHSWGLYHWARTGNPFTLKLGDNVSGVWDTHLTTTSADWDQSTVLDTTIVPGSARKNCRATAGRVEVCNAKYGFNGWLGIAQIWITGGEHITQGTTKVNDSYFNQPTYNTGAWRDLVMCQEVGHTFGLGHQDEDFDNANLGSCMDYTSSPESNRHPNQHDYNQLEAIYAHLDSFTTITSSTSRSGAPFLLVTGDYDHPGDWGQKVADNGHLAVFERDFGQGVKLLTRVIWAEGRERQQHSEE